MPVVVLLGEALLVSTSQGEWQTPAVWDAENSINRSKTWSHHRTLVCGKCLSVNLGMMADWATYSKMVQEKLSLPPLNCSASLGTITKLPLSFSFNRGVVPWNVWLEVITARPEIQLWATSSLWDPGKCDVMGEIWISRFRDWDTLPLTG